MDTIKQIKALFYIRLRLLYNTIISKAGISKIIGFGLAALITIIATASAASDVLEGIFKLPFANIIAEWGIGTLILYGIFIVFTGDLVSGHTLNTGQMSSDFRYLSTLPIPTTILIITKLFERFITDYFGILFLLPALIGISCYKAFTFKSFLAAFLLYFEISFLIGLLINLLTICLTRFFKTSTINNFFSIFGYISAILTLIPFLLLSNFNPSHVPMVIDTIDYLHGIFGDLLLPIKWMATPILYSTPFCTDFAKITVLWLIIVCFLTILFHIAVKNNWFSYVHSSKATANTNNKKHVFSGLIRKDILMMKSDLNLLVNAILMPISIIAVEIYFLKKVFSFTTVDSIMNFIFGSIVYFSLFGPINIIGYEGKAISLLEAMPITPADIIKKKYKFWVIIALIIFIPATIATFQILSFDFDITLKAVFLTTIFTLASVWITISISAIFAKYDTAILQQHSTFVGKMVAILLISILLPLKNISFLNLYSLLLFIIMSCLCYIKAQAFIAFRQDKEALNTENHSMLNCILLFLSFILIENNNNQFFNSVIPDTNTGIWSWCLTLPLILPFAIIYRKKSSPILYKTNFKDLTKSVLAGLIPLLITIFYLKSNSSLLSSLISNSEHIAIFSKIIFLSDSLWKTIMLLAGSLMMIIFVKRANEFLFSNKDVWAKILGYMLILLVSINNLIPFIGIYLIFLAIFNFKQQNASVTFYSSVIFFMGLFYFLIF